MQSVEELEAERNPPRTGSRATRGAFKKLRNPVIPPDFTTMDPKFMTPAQRAKFAPKEGYEL